MIVFVDFEASSLGKGGFPVEVGWVADDGWEESHLIRPAPGWEEWNRDAEQVHGIPLDRLLRDGAPHQEVAQRMAAVLAGHDLYASAPSWDGQWLSKLLRAAGLPRHALRLRDTEEAQRLAALRAFENAAVPVGIHGELLKQILAEARDAAEKALPAHRALEDARRELRLWRDVGLRASEVAARWTATQAGSRPRSDSDCREGAGSA